MGQEEGGGDVARQAPHYHHGTLHTERALHSLAALSGRNAILDDIHDTMESTSLFRTCVQQQDAES